MIGRRSPDRLEHRDALGVEVAARGDAHASLDHRAEVRDDVAEHVVGDDHVEARRPVEEVDAARVDVHVVGLDVGELGRELVDHPLIQIARERQHVRLVHERELAPPVGTHRELEGVAHDPLDPVARVDALLHRDLVLGSLAMEASRARVQALGVLADDDHVDVLLGMARHEGLDAGIALDRTQVHVLVELEAQAEQQIPLEDPRPHARVADGAEQHRVEPAHRIELGARKRLAGAKEPLRPEVELLELDLEPGANGLEHLERLAHDLRARFRRPG